MKSPVARFAKENGDLSTERLQPSKLFHRKLKMIDSFTRVVPSYKHVPKSGYTSAVSHYLHPLIKESVDNRPIAEINRDFTHKMDLQKNEYEAKYKLGKFGP